MVASATSLVGLSSPNAVYAIDLAEVSKSGVDQAVIDLLRVVGVVGAGT